MTEYIEREALLCMVQPDDPSDEKATITIATAKKLIRNIVSCTTAADVAPVRHGKWEIVVGSNGKEYMVCTCCRVSQDLTGVFSYCPNCGAKMDLED